jgi:uncharacterized protein YlxP (DUF503 family)
MVVGVLTIRLRIAQSGSLKAKRKVVKAVVSRVKNTFNVSCAEVDDMDVHQSAIIGVVAVGNDRSYINSKLDKALNFVEHLHLAEILDHDLEILNIQPFGNGANFGKAGHGPPL